MEPSLPVLPDPADRETGKRCSDMEPPAEKNCSSVQARPAARTHLSVFPLLPEPTRTVLLLPPEYLLAAKPVPVPHRSEDRILILQEFPDYI